MDWKWFTNKVIEVLCNLAFITTVVIYAYEYSKSLTSTVSEVKEDLQMKWPSLTFCTSQGYKKQGFHYQESEYIKNTFRLEDIFTNETLEKLRNETRYKVTEIRSITNGRCYTVQGMKTAKVLKLDDSVFTIKRNQDLILIVHQEETQFFLIHFIFPLKVRILNLPLTQLWDKGNAAADLHLEKEEMALLPKRGKCKVYSDQDQTFEDCLRNVMIGTLKDWNIQCLPATYQSLQIGNQHFENCDAQDVDVAYGIHQKCTHLMGKVLTNTSLYGCLKPCNYESYNANMNFFHKFFFASTSLNQPGDYFYLFVYFDTLDVKKVQEVVVFGAMDFLSSIGGTLGLLLGYSACSIVVSVFNMAYNAFFQN